MHRVSGTGRVVAVFMFVLVTALHSGAATAQYTFEQIRSVPYPQALTAAADGSRIAWVADDRGRRNVWVAAGPAFEPRRLTNYLDDDGQEITSLSLSRDGAKVVYVRGGEHSANWQGELTVNAASHPRETQVAVWVVSFAGGEPRLIGEGDFPAISPDGTSVAFVKNDQAWIAATDGAAPARRMFVDRGRTSELRWSADGARLAFVSNREAHSFIGVYSNDATPIAWQAPGVTRDVSPRWSPDGARIAFIRTPGDGGAPPAVTAFPVRSWEIWSTDVETGAARRLWQSGTSLRDSWPDGFFDWWADDRVVFESYQDGWQHLYAVSEGSAARLLTPGDYMVEDVASSPDRKRLVFSANTGEDADDIERRHLYEISPGQSRPRMLTRGAGLEYSPVVAADGSGIFLSATAQRPPQLAMLARGADSPRWLGSGRLPAEFPLARMVTPRRVQFRAEDGVLVSGQLFEPVRGSGRGPAVVYIHGGPRRQMVLGWHSVPYYGNTYAINQYLASRGFTVLAVNYRLGVGYGHAFNYPPEAGEAGAAELRDVRAAGRYLQSLPGVDQRRVGVYGGSYGGYLTAMALAHDSSLFAAGVDIHGVHDWVMQYDLKELFTRTRYELAPGAQGALDTAWRASPVFAVASWKSPVLFIHGDDDRNVRFSQMVDLVRRLEGLGVHYETLVLPDETHDFKRFETQLRVNRATVSFLERFLGNRHGTCAGC